MIATEGTEFFFSVSSLNKNNIRIPQFFKILNNMFLILHNYIRILIRKFNMGRIHMVAYIHCRES